MTTKRETMLIAGLAGAITLALLLKKKVFAMSAAVSMRVLDAQGQEVPHNSPVELEPGSSYTIEVTVANLSTSKGEPIGADLRTTVAAVVDSTPLMPTAQRTDSYGPSESLVLTWPLNISSDIGAASGAISAIVLDPNGNNLAAATLPITITVAMRPAINGMGDLNNDGYVTEEDAQILTAYIAGSPFAGFDISDISPLSMWEFVRRADLNYDANIDANDMTAIENFIAYGTLPTPQIGKRAAINGMGDLNNDGYVSSVDIKLCGLLMQGYAPSEVSPLSEAELLRRADMNGDGQVNILDILIMTNFINTGELPQPPEEIIYAASIDVII